MAEWKPVRIGVRMLATLVTLQVLNTLLLVAVLAGMGGQEQSWQEPELATAPPAPTFAPAVQVMPGNRGIGDVLASLVSPLRAAMDDMGEDSATLLPSDEEILAAVESGRLGSPASKRVLEKLEAGYAMMRMPFPELAPPSQ